MIVSGKIIIIVIIIIFFLIIIIIFCFFHIHHLCHYNLNDCYYYYCFFHFVYTFLFLCMIKHYTGFKNRTSLKSLLPPFTNYDRPIFYIMLMFCNFWRVRLWKTYVFHWYICTFFMYDISRQNGFFFLDIHVILCIKEVDKIISFSLIPSFKSAGMFSYSSLFKFGNCRMSFKTKLKEVQCHGI